jgi:RimJ/RimL family protein N-acetyltransferase
MGMVTDGRRATAHTVHMQSSPEAGRLIAAITTAASTALGHELPEGTTVVGSADRTGSPMAVLYPLGERTIVWCAPELQERLAALNDPRPLDRDEFVERCVRLGGAVAGSGHLRVLSRPAPEPALDPTRLISLNRDEADDRRLIAALVRECSQDDLDEAELALDQLDEALVAVLDRDGAIASLAGARPWVFDDGVDDVMVITHPAHRGRGLAAAAVAALSQRRQREGTTMFYNCDVENVGSNRVAEAVGFDLVFTVTAASFG